MNPGLRPLIRFPHVGENPLFFQVRFLARKTRSLASESLTTPAKPQDSLTTDLTAPSSTNQEAAPNDQVVPPPAPVKIGFQRMEDLDSMPIRVVNPEPIESPRRPGGIDIEKVLRNAAGRVKTPSILQDLQPNLNLDLTGVKTTTLGIAGVTGSKVLVRKVQQELLDAPRGAGVLPKSFAEAGIGSSLVERLEKAGISRPTEIQAEMIPAILKKKDLIIKSETGTGKTLGFVLALVNQIDIAKLLSEPESDRSLKAIIMVPTRELAFQTHQWIKHFANLPSELDTEKLVQCLVNDGPENNAIQQQLLSKTIPRIIVGTGHRLDSLAKENQLPQLFRVETVFVDEVDKVLGALTSHAPIKKVQNRELHPKPGAEFLDFLLQNARTKYQTVVASATANTATRSLLARKNWIKDPVRIQLCGDDVSLPLAVTHQFVYCNQEGDQFELLRKLAKDPSFTAGLVFVNNETGLVRYCHKLLAAGIKGVFPLSDAYQDESNFGVEPKLPQDSEQEVLKISPVTGLLQGKIKYLVGTEDMSRGIDLPGISHVIVLDLPKEMQSFLHQSGRTGRMGKSGSVIAFYNDESAMKAKAFAGYLNLAEQVSQVNQRIQEIEERKKAEKPVVISANKAPAKPKPAPPKPKVVKITYRE